jgi:hypothetical protein
MKAPFAGVFRSLRGFNYRVWVAGAFVSNFVQRRADDRTGRLRLGHRRDRHRLGFTAAVSATRSAQSNLIQCGLANTCIQP